MLIPNTAWKEGPASHPPHVSRHCRTASSLLFFGVFDTAVVDVAVAAAAVDAAAAAAVAAAVDAAFAFVAAVAVAADTTGRCFECLPANPEPEN